MRTVKNNHLNNAKRDKKDEFYTQYSDIESEISAYLDYNKHVFLGKTVLLPCDDPVKSQFTAYFITNFEKLGLKKLVSTSIANEYENETKGRILEVDASNIKTILGQLHDGRLQFDYLKGDGDFRSQEITLLRDKADIIVTNPPFSLFREFVSWVVAKEDIKFSLIGNINAITYKEVFPLIKDNKMWLGVRFNKRINGKNMGFYVPDDYPLSGTEAEVENGRRVVRIGGVGWFTNFEHNRRHKKLPMVTMADNLENGKKLKSNKEAYQEYQNYKAIEVPETLAIPVDYKGVMGVPITFLDKYNPEQFDILGITKSWDFSDDTESLRKSGKNRNGGILINKDGQMVEKYVRILIKHKTDLK